MAQSFDRNLNQYFDKSMAQTFDENYRQKAQISIPFVVKNLKLPSM